MTKACNKGGQKIKKVIGLDKVKDVQGDGVVDGRFLGALGYEWMTLRYMGLDTNDRGCTR